MGGPERGGIHQAWSTRPRHIRGALRWVAARPRVGAGHPWRCRTASGSPTRLLASRRPGRAPHPDWQARGAPANRRREGNAVARRSCRHPRLPRHALAASLTSSPQPSVRVLRHLLANLRPVASIAGKRQRRTRTTAGRARARRPALQRSRSPPRRFEERLRPVRGPPRGPSSESSRPYLSQPTRASQVRGDRTGAGPGGRGNGVRHPSSHAADERGSRPLASRTCFRQF